MRGHTPLHAHDEDLLHQPHHYDVLHDDLNISNFFYTPPPPSTTTTGRGREDRG